MNKLKQQGSSTILFTMFIIMIIGLIAIGFAFIVRSDQRAILDKTLSNQAQYAAESAINKISLGLANASIPANNNACNGGLPSQTPTGFPTGVAITCLTWTNTPNVLSQSTVSTKPWVTHLQPQSSSIASIKITWVPNAASDTQRYGTLTQLQISPNYIPILKLVISDNVLSSAKVAYLIPSSSNSGNMSGTSGMFIHANCASSSPYMCTAIIDGFPGAPVSTATKALLSLNAIGNTAGSVNVYAYDGAGATGTQLNLVGAQATIDATARSQDVTKRLKAAVPLTNSTWRPSFAVSSDTLCKNYKLDANQNDQPGPIYSDVCPE